MEYKSLDFVAFSSLVLGALSVLGAAVLTFGPWPRPSTEVVRMMLTFSWLAFWMIGTVARNVGALLRAQVDELAALQRQLAEQRPAA